MTAALDLSRRQAVALTLLCAFGLLWAGAQVAFAGGGGAVTTAPSLQRVTFTQANQAALCVAPGLSPSDVRLRFRQLARDSSTPWKTYREQVGWTPAREAVIARYVDLPALESHLPAESGPRVRRHAPRKFRLWP